MTLNTKGHAPARQVVEPDGVHIGRDTFVPDYIAPADLGGEDKPHDLHPYDVYLRRGRLPHIWCDGCGLGTALTCFIEGVHRSEVEWEKLVQIASVSGWASVTNRCRYCSTAGAPACSSSGARRASGACSLWASRPSSGAVAQGGIARPAACLPAPR